LGSEGPSQNSIGKDQTMNITVEMMVKKDDKKEKERAMKNPFKR